MTTEQHEQSNALWKIINYFTVDLQESAKAQDWTRWKESFAARGMLFQLEATIRNPDYGIYEPFVHKGIDAAYLKGAR